jgi:5,10-methenyltetrahydrofolate synthetase/tRNA threonylcarbamoyl adenosine modification protein YjeE
LTVSYGSEVDTHPLLEERLSLGLPFALPKTFPDGTMEFYRVLRPLSEMRATPKGILEPDPQVDAQVHPNEIDLFILPGIGFDPWGNRLGQGRAFFDRYLARVAPGIPKIGLAFDCQMVESLPATPTDIPVHRVLTERSQYQVQAGEWLSQSVESTHRLAATIAACMNPPALIRLSGDLGAGKTEWVRGFLRSLGWDRRVRSPTFGLEHVYSFGERGCVVHLDGYRLSSPSELDYSRLQEILEDPQSMVLIEWPDRFGCSIPPFSPHLVFERRGQSARHISWTAFEVPHHLESSTIESIPL